MAVFGYADRPPASPEAVLLFGAPGMGINHELEGHAMTYGIFRTNR